MKTYTAVFSDATSVNRGDDVRMVGVKVGTVQDVGLTQNRLAKVKFTIRKGVRLDAGTRIQVKFRNLVGQRYLAVEQPDLTTATTVSAKPAIAPGHVFGLEETRGALDLTLLFNGFRPLLRMLDADDVNKLSEQIVAVFQGEDATVDGLLSSTASVTSTLAQKDQVIGELITSLSSVMSTVNDRSGQLDTTLVTMQQLVSGLAQDRAAIGDSITGMGELTSKVATLFEDTRPSIRASINDLGAISRISTSTATRSRTSSRCCRSSSTGSAAPRATAPGSTSTCARWTDGFRWLRATWATWVHSPLPGGAADVPLPRVVR